VGRRRPLEQSQADAICERYGLDDAQESTAGLVLPAIYIIGACVVGGGAISFVAAHWDSISIPVRIGLLLTVMLGCEISGFVLWKVKGTREKLGQALVALGAVIFGANVFLIAQMYHLQGPPHSAFGVWTLGALSVAYTTFSAPTMALACITSFVWSTGWIETDPHDFCWYPFAICAACVPVPSAQLRPQLHRTAVRGGFCPAMRKADRRRFRRATPCRCPKAPH